VSLALPCCGVWSDSRSRRCTAQLTAFRPGKLARLAQRRGIGKLPRAPMLVSAAPLAAPRSLIQQHFVEAVLRARLTPSDLHAVRARVAALHGAAEAANPSPFAFQTFAAGITELSGDPHRSPICSTRCERPWRVCSHSSRSWGSASSRASWVWRARARCAAPVGAGQRAEPGGHGRSGGAHSSTKPCWLKNCFTVVPLVSARPSGPVHVMPLPSAIRSVVSMWLLNLVTTSSAPFPL
jgi:hypothetical protein